MTDQIRFSPFRELNDFIAKAENYAIPDLNNVEKFSNRVTNNLLYYQTNYFIIFLIMFVLISVIHPVQFVTGLVIFIGLFVGGGVLSKKYVEIQRFKRDKPSFYFIGIVLISGFLFKLFGSLLIFLFSICLPISLIFLHSALRTRNIMNKIENKKEWLGLTRTPMGVLLESLDFLIIEKIKE